MIRRACPLLLVCFLAISPAHSPVHAGEADELLKESLDGLSGAAALELVKELAADEMKGRKTGFAGGAAVENWMLAKMSEFGLHPADAAGTYLEPFAFGASATVAPIALTVAGKKLAYGTDYFDLTYTGSGKVKAEAVFVGYGIVRPDLGWDDYAGLDVQGKIVVAIRGAPAARATEFREERFIGYKTSTAADKGAAGFLLVQNDGASTGTIQARFHRGTLPALWLSGKAADALFAAQKTTLAELKKTRDEGEPGKGFATGVQVAMEVNAKFTPNAKGHNALGSIKGRDPDLKDEIILVGAHMDHLGVGPDGQVFNGADDNASGTGVMIHLADVLTRNRFRPKRTVIFCGFGAEEQGLHGSRALAARYPFQGRVVCVLNMDMVGQGEPNVRISGGGSYPKMQALMKAALPDAIEKQVTWGLRTGGGSDHWPFHERGVPAFGIWTKGKHPNYHTPKDDVANIKPECLEAAARVVGSLIVKLATHEQPLHDDSAILEYLLREGPRFGGGPYLDKDVLRITDPKTLKAVAFDPIRHARDLGVSCVLLTIPEERDPVEAWKALEALEAPKGSPYRLVRRAADVGRAWREGRVAILPRLACAARALKSPADLAKLKAIGYRLVAPWNSGTDKTLASSEAQGIVQACKAAGLVPDLSDLSVSAWAEAREALGSHPAVLITDPDTWRSYGALTRQLGGAILPLLIGEPGLGLRQALGKADGFAPPVLLEDHGDVPSEALRAWAAEQPEGWDLPGSPQRKALRAALGGRLVQWLAKAER